MKHIARIIKHRLPHALWARRRYTPAEAFGLSSRLVGLKASLAAIFPPRRHYNATITYSGLTFNVTIEAPDERRALMELEEIADGGFVIDFVQA